MMQGFYLLAMQQARRRTLLAALACLSAMISLVLAGRALLASPAVPASASITYTVQSENRPACHPAERRLGPAHRHRHAHAAIRRAASACGRHYTR